MKKQVKSKISKTIAQVARTRLLKFYRGRIKDHEKEQDRLFKLACQKLGVKPNDERGDILWDHLFNQTYTHVEVAKRLWPIGESSSGKK